jgi:hypothetical protein
MAAGYGVAAIAGGVGAYLWWRAGRGGPVVAPAGVDRVTVRWRF